MARSLILTILVATVAGSANGINNVLSRPRLMRSLAATSHRATSSQQEGSLVGKSRESIQDSANEHFQKRGGQKASLAHKQHKCGVGPIPHYPEVNLEHEAVCGNKLDSCKPDDELDIFDDDVLDLQRRFFVSTVHGDTEGRQSAREEARTLMQRLKDDAQLRDTFANEIVVSLSPVGALAASGRGSPPESERSAWTALSKANSAKDTCVKASSLCSCAPILCNGGQVSYAHLMTPHGITNLAPLSRFSKLRVAVLGSTHFASDAWKGVRKMNQLRTLVLYMYRIESADLAAIARSAPDLEFLDVKMRAGKEPKEEDARPARDLQPLCKLKKLKYLNIYGPFTGLPSCFSNMQGLLHLDVRGLWLNQPLPASFAALTNIRTFIAFGQREHHCPAPDCIASIANRIQFEPAASFWCPSGGWTVPLQTIMFPQWKNIEKFWVDQNFLTGAIPKWLPEKWPSLRSLDLYSNRLSGEIPTELVAMPKLFQLQLHDNDFTGSVPAAEALGPALKFLDVSVNSKLGGCWPQPHSLDRVQEKPVLLGAHSSVEKSENCKRASSPKLEA